MKSLQDAIYNWLSIKVVCDARPDDTAAKETERAFYRILEDDFGIVSIDVKQEEDLYRISCRVNQDEHTYRFPRELIDCILNSINENPDRYRNYE